VSEHPAHNYGAWPEQMRAETAAAFCDEPLVDAFRRFVGKLYPRPYRVPGKGDRWSRGELEVALKRQRGEMVDVKDAVFGSYLDTSRATINDIDLSVTDTPSKQLFPINECRDG
jgi:hypothetical protein